MGHVSVGLIGDMAYGRASWGQGADLDSRALRAQPTIRLFAAVFFRARRDGERFDIALDFAFVLEHQRARSAWTDSGVWGGPPSLTELGVNSR